jgi:hypothetical protein
MFPASLTATICVASRAVAVAIVRLVIAGQLP